MVHPRLHVRLISAGLILGSLLLGLSCSGPATDASESTDDGVERVYHVQLEMTEDKGAADQVLAEAVTWWNERVSSSVPDPVRLSDDASDRPVTVVWKAPLYRVRLGPFASRSQAEDVLGAAQSVFPDAFVAPERLSPQQ